MPTPASSPAFRVGRGIADITGEPSDCGMLGYGKAQQQTSGIHLRLRSRAFAFEDSVGDSVLLIVAELPLIFDSIHREVLGRLDARYGDRYTARNVMLTATHTHCGPGGYSHHRLYNATTGGFHPQTFEAIVLGIVESVERAHTDLAPATLTLAHGELHDASWNRSPTSFARNPAEDRAVFPRSIDPQTTQLTIGREGQRVGAVNWFATHGTSLTNKNTLISGDNKGYAAYHWERLVEGVDYLDDTAPPFVAAFAQTNTGDMSPNQIRGSRRGPTDDEFENTRIIGTRQYDAAARLSTDAGDPVGTGVDSRFLYVNLSRRSVTAEFTGDGEPHQTGTPIAGASAVAGTDEGDGFPGFHQGHRNPLLAKLSDKLYDRSSALRDTHSPKALVLPGGMLNKVTPVVAETYPVQLLRIGRLYLIGIAGEVTIVAGLRLRRTVAEIVGAEVRDVLVAGYSNGYFHYVTTPEEYDEQRYEGGSTLFGRWQLAALQQAAAELAKAMTDGRTITPGFAPKDLSPRARTRRHPSPDVPLKGRRFGDVTTEPHSDYGVGSHVEIAVVSGNLNSDLRRGRTYFEVQRAEGDDWIRVFDDGDWCTKMQRSKLGKSTIVRIRWDIPNDTAAGRYRITFNGSVRGADGSLSAFTATSNVFAVHRQP